MTCIQTRAASHHHQPELIPWLVHGPRWDGITKGLGTPDDPQEEDGLPSIFCLSFDMEIKDQLTRLIPVVHAWTPDDKTARQCVLGTAHLALTEKFGPQAFDLLCHVPFLEAMERELRLMAPSPELRRYRIAICPSGVVIFAHSYQTVLEQHGASAAIHLLSSSKLNLHDTLLRGQRLTRTCQMLVSPKVTITVPIR